jgi:Shikimate 5-dehydrogenase
MLKEKTFWADTEFFGLLGNPVRKSLSPAMHNANFHALGMNAVYTPYEVTETTVGTVIPALEALRFKGLNITMPLKQKIIEYLDELDEIASLCNAVNTVYWKDGRLCGSNTDGVGFVRGLKEQGGYNPAGKQCLIFGAGGAARGVAFALAGAGIGSIALWKRARERKAQETRKRSQCLPCRDLQSSVQRSRRHPRTAERKRTDNKLHPSGHGSEYGFHPL